MINKTITFIVVIASLVACAPTVEENPQDLAGLKTLLDSKKQELSVIKSEITELETKIQELTPADQIKTKLVTVDTISKEVFRQYTEVQAMVVAEDFVNASSEVGGLITNVYVQEGDYVQRGRKIASVDMGPMEKQLEELKTNLQLATTVFERQDRLWKQNIGSELQYLEAKTNKERLEQSIASLEETIKKKHVYAPIAGFVDREFLKAGEISGPGTPIVNILNTNKLKLVADVPENYLGTVNRGDIVNIYFPAINLSTKAKVNMLGRSIDPSNRTFKLELNVSKYAKSIKPNLLAKVTLNNYTNPEAVVLEADLVQKNVDGLQFIYTAVKSDQNILAKQILVNTGKSYNNKIEITNGLDNGDIVVVKGARTINDGNHLNIQNQ